MYAYIKILLLCHSHPFSQASRGYFQDIKIPVLNKVLLSSLSGELEHNAVAWLLGFLVSPASEHVVWHHCYLIKWESLTFFASNAFNVHCGHFQLGTSDFQIQT